MRMSTTAAALLLAATVPAQAVVIGGAVTGGSSLSQGGTFIERDASTGFTVGNDTFQDPNLYAFDEDQNITIPSTIDVDIGTSPTAGKVVASHYVFFDPENTTSQSGHVDFDAPIYGVATSTGNLADSDFLLASDVTYLSPSARGLESGDSVGIDPGDANRLLVDWQASSPGDFVRVFTQRSPGADDPDPGVIPLPAGFPLLLGGLGALSAFGMRRRRAQQHR